MKAYYVKKSAILQLLKDALDKKDPKVFDNAYKDCKSRKIAVGKSPIDEYPSVLQSALLALYYTFQSLVANKQETVDQVIDAVDAALTRMQAGHDLKNDDLCPNCAISTIMKTAGQLIEEGTTHPLEKLFGGMSGPGGFGNLLAMAVMGMREEG